MLRQFKLYDSLRNEVLLFKPLNDKRVTMYVCGPTVYSRPHIGNLRAAVTYDVLYRVLRYLYNNSVYYVRNITDVDDKIINRVRLLNVDSKEFIEARIKEYADDCTTLGCLIPDREPRVSLHIDRIISIIENLIRKGHAYCSAGNVFFSTGTYSEYGKLSNRKVEDMIENYRIKSDPLKKDQHDFILWKTQKENEEDFTFQSPWGRGRPGWHIECSAMSTLYLGENFDIHGGGIDLIFPHHENEQAQSICSSVFGTFVNYWVHSGLLTDKGDKMSKSAGNFCTFPELLHRGYTAMGIRYFLLTAHYRNPLDLTDKGLDASTKAVVHFRKALYKIKKDLGEQFILDLIKQKMDIHEKYLSIILEDMNVPKLLAELHGIANVLCSDKSPDIGLINSFVLSLDFLGFFDHLMKDREDLNSCSSEVSMDQLPYNISKLITDRIAARKNKQWGEADRLREEILQSGYNIEDCPGTIMPRIKKFN